MQQKTPHSYSHGAWAAGDQRMVFVVTFGNAIAPRGRLLLCDLSNRRERGWEGGQISALLRVVLEGAHKGREGGLGGRCDYRENEGFICGVARSHRS